MSIVKLDRENFEAMVHVDEEANHPIDSMINLNHNKILEERFEKGDEEFFGYIENDELKGYIGLTYSPKRGRCRIYWLSVKNKFHGRGIGTKLAKFAEENSREKGFDKIIVCTNKLMDKARKFYEGLGFEFSLLIKGYYNYPNIKYNTAVFYAKALKTLDF